MTPNELINKFYTDKTYKNSLISKVATKQSKFSPSELSNHRKDMNNLYYDLLLDKISDEIYPYKKDVRLEETI